MPAGLAAIDWGQPWLGPWRALGEPLAQAVEAGMPLHEAFNAAASNGSGSHVRFVPQSALPLGEAYESYIFNRRLCPVREGLHDFFNGLCWLQFPKTKAQLNALHMQQIAERGRGAPRGPVRDALTVFDENAAFLMADAEAADAIWPALLRKDWNRLLLELRPLWRDASLLVFGHALLEKLVTPRKPVTAHVIIASHAICSIANLDAAVAQQLGETALAAKPFAPLPVLGVPGWWSANEDPAFYDDPKVFRVAT